MLSISVLTTLRELENVREEWIDLWQRSSPRTPFQRPEWVITWCRHFDCQSIWTPIARKSGRLVGLAPWLIYEAGSRRLVAFLAGGVSDYHDVLVEDGAGEALDHLFACLHRHHAEWDRCDFEQLAPWSALRRWKPSPAFRDVIVEEQPCPQISIPAPPAPLSDAVPSHQLARLRKYRRRAERQGELVLERSSAETIADAWDDACRLHRACWEGRGSSGALGAARLQSFHTEVVSLLAPVCARVDRVKLDGTTIAALYGFIVDRVKYCYLQGVDPAVANLSPGLLLVGLALEDAQCEGVSRVDFLRGDEPYKLAWGAAGLANARRQFWLHD